MDGSSPTSERGGGMVLGYENQQSRATESISPLRHNTADARRCTPMHADGPEPGMLVHGRRRTSAHGEPHRCDGPCPIRVHRRASACICVECLLASPRAAFCRQDVRPLCVSQNPMHLYRPRPARNDPNRAAHPDRDSGSKTMHQFSPLFRQAKTASAGNIPCPAGNCPTGAAHRLAQSTMRRW